jgi:Protein of unknown function (DUF1449)
MSMDVLLAPEALPFAIASLVVLLIGLVEIVGLLTVSSPSSILDSILPEQTEGNILGWLHLGKVPALVILVLAFGSFAIFGYMLQAISHTAFGRLIPATIAGVIAIPLAIAAVRTLGLAIGRLIPSDETSAVSELSLVGRLATITNGSAKPGMAAQARTRDKAGRVHFILVEPDVVTDSFGEGSQVLLVRKSGAFYRCIANPHPSLS